jgi:hypothetical protein
MNRMRLITFLASAAMILCCAGLVFAAGKGKYEEPLTESGTITSGTVKPQPPIDWGQMSPLVGTFTTLSGFYDYQSNGGSIQQIRVNPATGNIHVTYMLAEDSTAGLGDSRRVGYAFSTNGGATWNNFGNLRVPQRRAGFPSIDLGRGPIAGAAIIANHSVIGTTGNQSTIYIDFPEGGGAFSEIPPPASLGGDEPIWPYVACASDGSVTMGTSRSTAATVHWARTTDYVSWSPLTQIIGPTQGGGRYPTQANGTGRVGIVANTSNGTAALGNWWLESTDNGASWSAPANIFPGRRTSPADTFNSYVHTDFVYNGNTPLFVFSEYITDERPDCDIVFWSQPTGFRVAVPFDSTKYFFDDVDQRFHRYNLGWASIGLSGSTIVVAFQAFQADTDSRGYHYSDIWFTQSNDGGLTWRPAENLTNTRFVDERYPSVSKWNAPGQANIVWSQKSRSGLYAFPGGADTVRASQVFYRKILADVRPVEGVAAGFRLSQNYPNPFNPATKIDYTVPSGGLVSIRVYNVLGEEVGTVVNGQLQPGTYQATFDAAGLPSGVYYYTMKAGSFSETKTMTLVK